MQTAVQVRRPVKKILQRHYVLFCFGLCWAVYFGTYIGRLNYSSAMAAMIGENVLTKAQAGSVSMAFFFCYGAGQLVNGFLGDRLSPRWMIFTGLGVSALANLSMGLFGGFAPLVAAWGVNGYVQSMIWPPIVRVFYERFEYGTRLRACIHITSTMALGTLASYLLSALMMRLSGWQAVFYLAAAVLVALAAVWAVGFGRVERYAEENGVESAGGEEDAPPPGVSERQPFVPMLLSSGLLLILIPVIVHGVLKDGVTTWVPTYISEVFRTSPELSVLVTTVLPIVNLTGAYAADYMNQRVFHNEITTAFFFFLTASAALAALWLFGSAAMLLSVLLLAVITSSMLAVNTMFVNLIPLRFGKAGRASTVSGFLNSMAYLGSAVSTFVIGVVVERAGWTATILSWLVITAAAGLLCFLVRRHPPQPRMD